MNKKFLLCTLLITATLSIEDNTIANESANNASSALGVANNTANAMAGNATNITEAPMNMNMSNEFKEGDSIYIESTAIANSYLFSNIDGCKDKKQGETCGDLKAFFGTNQNTRYILRKGQGNQYCLQVSSLPNIFAFIKNVKNCNQNDYECADGMNIAGTNNQCQAEYAFIPIMVTDNVEKNLFALQSVINPNVFLRMNARDCANQIGVRDNRASTCGSVKGRFASNVQSLRRGDFEVFRIINTTPSS
jgi:hypothetical protein